MSARLTEITRALPAPFFLLEEVRRFDEDAMLAIFIKRRGMATFFASPEPRSNCFLSV